MKKTIFLWASLLCIVSCFSPATGQRNAIGFHAQTNEFIGDLSNNNYSLYKFKNFKAGGAISLQQRLNSSFSLVEWAGFNQVEYIRENNKRVVGQNNGVDADFFNLNIMLKYKFNNGYFLKEEAAISPFIIGGFGATHIRSKLYGGPGMTVMSKPDGETKANFMAGAGLFFRFSEVFGIEAASIFNRPAYDGWDGIETKSSNDKYLQHSIGLIFSLKKPADTDKDGVIDKKDKCANTPPGVKVDATGCPIDTDTDGVADYIDKCPQQPGSAAMNGCPDTDNDGVADPDDKCPAVPGLPEFAGCPDTDGDKVEDSKDNCPNTAPGIPVDANGCPMDSDGDKVTDNNDKCPNTPAGTVVDLTGCPADTDKDGVLNESDKCPTTPGPATNNGCPELKEEVKKRLNFATRGIFFESGKAILKPESFPSLDEIINIINEYPDYNLRLGGHTDDVGTDANNQILSQARVDAVKSYLVNKGTPVSRLEASGYGESKPIATNKTAVGKSKNRRVEMELYLK